MATQDLIGRSNMKNQKLKMMNTCKIAYYPWVSRNRGNSKKRGNFSVTAIKTISNCHGMYLQACLKKIRALNTGDRILWEHKVMGKAWLLRMVKIRWMQI
jgi:hypothetical protein